MTNNDHKIEQLLETLKSIRLTTEEKQDLKRALEVNLQTPIGAPSPRIFFWQRYRVLVGVATLVILVSGTLSVAAEQALPGDALYPIKTKINEPVATWFSPKKVERQTQITETRLDEAEKLDQENKLTEPLKSTVKENILKQAAKQSETENADKNSRTAEKTETVLEKHQPILEKLDIQDESDNVDKKGQGHDKINSERNGGEERLTPTKGSGIKNKN